MDDDALDLDFEQDQEAGLPWGQFALVFAILFVATQVPLYLVTYPDILEFADHVARIHLLQAGTNTPWLQNYYAIDRSLIVPNLAMDALLPPLAGAVGAPLAVKLFASFASLSLASGTIALSRALSGRLSAIQLGVLIFSHNVALLAGYLNYVAALGVAFWLLAAWVRWGGRAGWGRFAAFAGGATVLYLGHLSAFGIYVLGVLGWQLRNVVATTGTAEQDADGGGRGGISPVLVAIGQFIPAEIIYVVSVRPTAAASWVEPQQALSWSAILQHKLVLLASLPLAGIPPEPSWLFVLPLLIVLLIMVAALRGVVRLLPAVGWIAIPVALSILLLPYSGFGSESVDARLLPALLLILWAGLEVNARAEAGVEMPILALTAMATIATSADALIQWNRRDADYAALRAALDRLPEGARVATVAASPARGRGDELSPYFAAWGIVDRSILLSGFNVMPFRPVWVGFRQAYVGPARLARHPDGGNPVVDASALQLRYDDVIVFGPPNPVEEALGAKAARLYETPQVRILSTGAASR